VSRSTRQPSRRAGLQRNFPSSPRPAPGAAPSSSTGLSDFPAVNPYAVEPLFDALHNRARPAAAGQAPSGAVAAPWLLFAVPILLVPVLLTAYWEDSLFTAEGFGRVIADFQTFAGYRAADGSTSFPLFRDYTSLIVVVSAGVTVPLVYLNCGYMKVLLGQIFKWDEHQLSAATANKIRLELDRLNLLYRRNGRLSPLYAGASTLSSGLLYLTFLSDGSFRRLVDPVVTTPVDWWADYGQGRIPAAIAWISIGSVCIYIFVKNNVLGYCFLVFFIRIRSEPW